MARVPNRRSLGRRLGDLISMLPARQTSRFHKAVSYGIAIVIVIIALIIRELIGPADIGLQFVTFFPAVALTAVFGGFWPGMLATALSLVLASYLYMPPYRAFSFDLDRATLVSNLVFLFDELMVCGAVQAMHNHYRNSRAASERLAESRNLLSALVEGTTDLIFVKDVAGRYLHCNGAHLRFSGKKLENLVGQDACSIFPEEQAHELMEKDAQVIADGKVVTFDEVIRQGNGEVRNFITTKGPIFDEDGNVRGLFGIARDVTESRRAEALLRENDGRMRAHMENSPMAIIAWDRHLSVTQWEGAAEEMFGWRADETVGTPLMDLHMIYEEDIPLVQQTMAKIMAGTSRCVVSANRNVTRNGKVIHCVWYNTVLVDEDGAMSSVLSQVLNVTEQKQAEQALMESEEFNRRIVASSSDCIKVLDLDGNLVSMSEGGQRLMEIADIGRYLGCSWIDLWQAPDRPAVSAAIAMACGGGQGRFLAYCPTETGAPKWWDVVVTAIAGSSGKIERLLAVSRDVTGRKQVEDELKAAKAEAERANNAKSRFLAAASHDLRQPLSALKLYVGVLGGKLDPEDRVLSQNMGECIAGLSDLLSKLLDLSKLEAGVVTPQVRNFAVDDMLSKVLAAHAPEAESKGLSLRCGYSGLAARTDPVLFQRIVGNLVANAVQYTERGGVLIACRRRQGRMWVEVWDTGSGIPEDKLGDIFEEFKRLNDDATTRGSGLGLAIVAKTASLLGLQIRVRSRLNRGSVFAIELPPGRTPREVGCRQVKSSLRSARVAVVDDNPIVLNALVCALQNEGHEVVAANTGRDLLARLDASPPDIMVCDYRLGAGETGFEVIASVRAQFGADLPAVIISGDTDSGLLRDMAGKGIAIQHKPVEFEDLQARIEEATR